MKILSKKGRKKFRKFLRLIKPKLVLDAFEGRRKKVAVFSRYDPQDK